MDNSDFRSMMEQYNQELMRMQQRAEVPPPPAPTVQPIPSSTTPTAFTAPLKVRVTSANGAVPIPDALVIVTREENGETIVEGSRITNSSGLTEPIILPAVDPTLTLQPGNNIPRIVYEVTVAAPDHYRARLSDIPLYGGIPTELPVSLIPLPEFADDPEQEIQYTTPPINL
ncbi:MAG: carboxypeptidase regulatory-like domain-containing protein [Clostridia bacterium]|nr:carboxypeptidase regulatory-like domain-containing protein [Clostridia bacterium]